MEHRCSPRKDAQYPVMFYQNGQVMQSGCVKNISMGGLFVQTSTLDWRRHQAIDVELENSKGTKLRLAAQMVYKKSQGVGVMFDSMDASQKKMLKNIFYLDAEKSLRQQPNVKMATA